MRVPKEKPAEQAKSRELSHDDSAQKKRNVQAKDDVTRRQVTPPTHSSESAKSSRTHADQSSSTVQNESESAASEKIDNLLFSNIFADDSSQAYDDSGITSEDDFSEGDMVDDEDWTTPALPPRSRTSSASNLKKRSAKESEKSSAPKLSTPKQWSVGLIIGITCAAFAGLSIVAIVVGLIVSRMKTPENRAAKNSFEVTPYDNLEASGDSPSYQTSTASERIPPSDSSPEPPQAPELSNLPITAAPQAPEPSNLPVTAAPPEVTDVSGMVVPHGQKKIIPLEGIVTQAVRGGDDKYLVFLVASKVPEIKILDLQTGEISGTIPANGRQPEIAASYDALFVIHENTIEQWDLKTAQLKTQKTFPEFIGMTAPVCGTATTGPLFVCCGTGQRTTSTSTGWMWHAFSPGQLSRRLLAIKSKYRNQYDEDSFSEPGMKAHCAADGETIKMWRRSVRLTGSQTFRIDLADMSAMVEDETDMSNPSNIRKHRHSSIEVGINGFDLTRTGLDSKDWEIQKITDSSIAIPLTGIRPEISMPIHGEDVVLTIEEQVFASARNRLFCAITSDKSKSQVELFGMDLQQLLMAAPEIEAMFAYSKPPLFARVGEKIDYQMAAASSKPDQLSFHLDYGPPGMTVTKDGRMHWQAEASNDAHEFPIIVSLTAGDMPIEYHAFTMRLIPLTQPESRVVVKVNNSIPVADAASNMKLLGLAFHNFHDKYNSFPLPAPGQSVFVRPSFYDTTGKAFLSWRVHLLPYLNEPELYEAFHLDEPWDSEHNKQLLPLMPKVFQSKGISVQPGYTCFLCPSGKGAVMENGLGCEIGDITDGTRNTILLVQADSDHAVPWTKPADYNVDPGKEPSGLHFNRNVTVVLTCDGASHPLDQKAILAPASGQSTESVWSALLTRSGGEVIGD